MIVRLLPQIMLTQVHWLAPWSTSSHWDPLHHLHIRCKHFSKTCTRAHRTQSGGNWNKFPGTFYRSATLYHPQVRLGYATTKFEFVICCFREGLSCTWRPRRGRSRRRTKAKRTNLHSLTSPASRVGRFRCVGASSKGKEEIKDSKPGGLNTAFPFNLWCFKVSSVWEMLHVTLCPTSRRR